MDSRPILGNKPPSATRTRAVRNIAAKLHPNGERGERVRNRPKPIGTRSTGNEFGEVRGRQKRPIYKDGPCSQGQRRRAK